MEYARLDAAPVDPNADEIFVPARDGVKLATDIYLPNHGDKHPTILVRLPYDKAGRYTFMPKVAPLFTERGYAFVVQDVAGKFRSGGDTIPFVREVDDGYDAIEWVVSQQWSNGDVGMWGDSYYGWTQWAAVASQHPALRAIVPRVTSAALADIRLGTRWDEGISPLYAADYFAEYWLDNAIYSFEVDWSHRPLREVFDEAFAAIRHRSVAADEFFADDPTKLGHRNVFGRVHPFDVLKIPVLHGGGWFDNIAPDQMRDFIMLQERQIAHAPQYLHMDSTDHENYLLSDLPITEDKDHDSNDEALARMLPRYVGPALDFFDLHLGRKEVLLPRVQWNHGYVGWQQADGWPPANAYPLRLFLTNAGNATRDAEGGGLTERPEAKVGAAEWTHDPAFLVPSTVVNPFAFLLENPDERSVEARDDVATFTSDAFERPLDLTGGVALTATFASSAQSPTVFAKLLDVAANGAVRMLTRGQAIAATANGDARLHLEMGHVGYRIQPGHRLRLHVASSDFPLYAWHPGTRESPWSATKGTSSRQRLSTGGPHQSHLTVWVAESVVEP